MPLDASMCKCHLRNCDVVCNNNNKCTSSKAVHFHDFPINEHNLLYVLMCGIKLKLCLTYVKVQRYMCMWFSYRK